jgi:hypothetical protein
MDSKQSGQTLAETLLATFILTTSLVAGLSLAIYAISASNTSKNQILATNLAREGIEVIRMMRDSNWLAAEPDPPTPDGDSSDDVQSCADLGGRFCYPKVYDGPYKDLNLGSSPATFTGGGYRIRFNSATRTWSLENVADYYLYLQADKSYDHVVNGISTFARQVSITYVAISDGTCSNPCNNRITKVESIVAWRGKNCTAFNTDLDLKTLASPCKVVIEEHLTNWRDYK